jgi:hypothetical protein
MFANRSLVEKIESYETSIGAYLPVRVFEDDNTVC